MNEPTLKDALESVEFELPALDDKTQAILAAHVYKALLFKHGINRLVSSISDLTERLEQSQHHAVGEGVVHQGTEGSCMEMY